jgi:hypothetical protein
MLMVISNENIVRVYRIFLKITAIGMEEVRKGVVWVSGAGEPPPCALLDTDVNLSAHPAPIIQPLVLFIRLCLLHRFLP